MTGLSAEGSHKGNSYGDAVASSIRVGDSDTNENLRGYFTFDLSSFPTDVGAAPVSATIHLTRDYTQGSPYTALCVPPACSGSTTMNLEHVAFGDLVLAYPLYSTPLLHNLGSLATAQSGDDLAASVMVAVLDDLASRTARKNRSQYRLRFPLETNNDNRADAVSIYANSALHRPYLSVQYQMP